MPRATPPHPENDAPVMCDCHNPPQRLAAHDDVPDTAEKGLSEPPVRLCCGQRHNGAMCPDGKVMCCACFERFNQADLVVLDGDTYDVCKGCEASVFAPAVTDQPRD